MFDVKRENHGKWICSAREFILEMREKLESFWAYSCANAIVVRIAGKSKPRFFTNSQWRADWERERSSAIVGRAQKGGNFSKKNRNSWEKL